jgi:hypothetical protein
MIRAGALLRADGGYLILDVRETLAEPGAWRVLLRTLKNGALEIVPPEVSFALVTTALKPEPIPVKIRVVLLGDAYIYYLLDAYDSDFSQLFKVLADFDDEIAREPEGVRQYSGVLARVARDESLLPFHKSAVARLSTVRASRPLRQAHARFAASPTSRARPPSSPARGRRRPRRGRPRPSRAQPARTSRRAGSASTSPTARSRSRRRARSRARSTASPS